MYQEKGLRGIDAAIILSMLLHAGALLLTSHSTPRAGAAFDMQEVTFMDVTYRPEVAKIMAKSAIPGGGGTMDSPSTAPTYASGVASDEVTPIDMSATLERDKSQAKIDLERYEMDRGSGMNVITLGGNGSSKSTDEILAQPKVQLSRGLARAGAGNGLRGFPGVPQQQAQITIEHRALSKPVARALPAMACQDLPKVEGPVARGTNFMVAGPISQREISKKVIPRYPRWALDRRVSGTVVVRIWVQPNGQVKGAPTVESSSGYPDLDQVVVDALRAWEFAALGSGVKNEDQWGVITFRFTLS
jgi:TonB family protein